MTTLIKLLTGALVALLLAACITTTSGTPEPEADDEEAAKQYYSLGARYFKRGQYELARDRLEYSLKFEPKDAVTHSVLAMTFKALDNPRMATEHFELAVRYGPKDIGVRNTYAVFLCQQRDYDDAREQFERAIELPENDDSEVMLTNAGVCMANAPDPEAAEEYFRRALAEKPGYGEALLQMALLKRNAEDNLGARAFLQRYLANTAASAGVLYLAVQIEDDLDNARASTDYTNQLLRDFPESAEARRLLQSR